MIYDLEFKKSAMKEWKKLDGVIQKQFKSKLEEWLVHPKVESDRLRCGVGYKIKLRNSGYRLIYTIDDSRIVVEVVAIGKRDSIYDRISKT
jgi:mRNA interferase RelE/StbE